MKLWEHTSSQTFILGGVSWHKDQFFRFWVIRMRLFHGRLQAPPSFTGIRQVAHSWRLELLECSLARQQWLFYSPWPWRIFERSVEIIVRIDMGRGIPSSSDYGAWESVVKSFSVVRRRAPSQNGRGSFWPWNMASGASIQLILEKWKTVIELSYSHTYAYDSQSTTLVFCHACNLLHSEHL